MDTEQTLNIEVLESETKSYLSSLRKQKEIGANEIAEFFNRYMCLEKFEENLNLEKIRKSFLKTISKMNENLSIYIDKNMTNILYKLKLGFQLQDIVIVPNTHLIAPVYESTHCKSCENYIKEKRTCQLKRGAYVFGCDFNLQEKKFLKENAISIFEKPVVPETPGKRKQFLKGLKKRVYNLL